MHVINYSRDSGGSGLGSRYEWLAGLVFRVCTCLHGGGGGGNPNTLGVQISRDRPP